MLILSVCLESLLLPADILSEEEEEEEQKETSSSSAAAAAASSVASHAAGASSAAAAAPAIFSPSLPFEIGKSEAVATFAGALFAFTRHESAHVRNAYVDLDQLLQALEKRGSPADTISAKVTQSDFYLLLQEQEGHKQRAAYGISWEELQPLRNAVDRALVDAAAWTGIPKSQLVVLAVKSLDAAFEQGNQPLHGDTARGTSSAATYSHLSYLTPGATSTAVPRYSRNLLDFAAAEYPGDTPLQAGEEVTDEIVRRRQRLAYPVLYDREHSYAHAITEPGDRLFFDQAMIHRGTPCTQRRPHHRRVLFVMIAGTQLSAARRLL